MFLGPTQELGNTLLTVEKEHSINFTKQQKKLSLSLHYNRVNSYIFVNRVEICKFKAKDSEINTTSLCLDNVSKHFLVDNMKKTGLYRYVYDFSVDCVSIGIEHMSDIHKNLVVNNNIKYYLD